jgi:SAM-dependent methyltransferase
MTTWDKIYKKYRNGGEAWATLSEDIDPLFISFIEESDFKLKNAFDIGCGTGKYLKFLKNKGFHVFGIDNSETAIEMSKENLGDSGAVEIADMYKYKIPQNKFDLILSVSTIHHGTKKQVEKLIKEIFDSLAKNGKIFITLPDFAGSKKLDKTDNKEISQGTFIPLSGPESGLPHSFYTKKEIESMFSVFQDIELQLDDIGRWFITGSKI